MKESNHYGSLSGIMLLALASPGLVPEAHAGSDEFVQCAKRYPDNDGERLKCYDSALPAKSETASSKPETDKSWGDRKGAATLEIPPADRSYLTRAWNLDNVTSLDQSRPDHPISHRQSYLLLRKTFAANMQPYSPAPGHGTLAPNDFDALEAKFQLSFKSDLIGQLQTDFLDFKTLRLWGAYTQQSNWQIFNTRNSSPFRETNYEPELIASFATGNQSGLRLVNLGLVHQSNGQHLPESRSWNRVYLQGGWERGNFAVLARGWYRIPENILKDDNPDIADYVGRADIVARWEPDDRSQAVTLLLRNNLSLSNNRGFMQLDWSVQAPGISSMLLHAQFSSGFGESMVDYNHRQNTLGMGLSFREW